MQAIWRGAINFGLISIPVRLFSATEEKTLRFNLHHKEDGLYACAGCGQPLYDSRTKYDSCGWPSFWDALPGAVATRDDGSGAPEAICSRCKGHLGHIFDDGPPPTGKRH